MGSLGISVEREQNVPREEQNSKFKDGPQQPTGYRFFAPQKEFMHSNGDSLPDFLITNYNTCFNQI